MPAFASQSGFEKWQQSWTPAMRAAYEKQKAITDAQVKPLLDRQKELDTSYGSVAPKNLSPIQKHFQKLVLARDWDSLFEFLPVPFWQRYGNLGKFSFIDQANGQRIYIPFSETDLRRYTFSPHYTVQPGYVCSDEQKEMGAQAHLKAGAKHKAKFPANDWRHVWPIYPGGGYGDQNFGCEKYRPSTWVKIRKPVAIAVGVVAAVYLGPIVYDKISGALASTTSAAEAGTGIVGAGTKAGAVAKTGTAVAAASDAAVKATLFTKVQTGVNIYNKAALGAAIIQGEMPPPPIGISGENFTEWATDVAKKELKSELMETVNEKVADEIVAKEESKIRAEIMTLQRELDKLIPPGTPIGPSPELDPNLRAQIGTIQAIEKERQQNMMTLLAVAIPAAFLMVS